MLDTVGPELQVVNKSEHAISLEADAFVTLTPDQSLEASSQLLPINFTGLSKACNDKQPPCPFNKQSSKSNLVLLSQ